MNFYNDIDPLVCAWTEELISAGLIPPGDVVCKPIQEIQPDELKNYSQCHFFNGISGWARAAVLAGIESRRSVWFASCPCQPFSCAGKGEGVKDERHLWPDFMRLARECRPDRIFGEQVASAIGFGWLDGISADLEAEGYAVGSVVLGAHSIGAPHKRQRLYWMANRVSAQWDGPIGNEDEGRRDGFADGGATGAMGDRQQPRLEGYGRLGQEPCEEGWQDPQRHSAEAGAIVPVEVANVGGLDSRNGRKPEGSESKGGERQLEQRGGACRLGIADSAGRHAGQPASAPAGHRSPVDSAGGHNSMAHAGHQTRRTEQPEQLQERSGWVGKSGFWSDFDIIQTRDGKFRRVPSQSESAIQRVVDGSAALLDALRDSGATESEIEEITQALSGWPLAGKVPGRVGLLKGAGNCILPELATQFIEAATSAIEGMTPKDFH